MDRRAFLAGAASLPLATAIPAPADEPQLYTAAEYYAGIPAGVRTGSVAWGASFDEIWTELLATGDKA